MFKNILYRYCHGLENYYGVSKNEVKFYFNYNYLLNLSKNKIINFSVTLKNKINKFIGEYIRLILIIFFNRW